MSTNTLSSVTMEPIGYVRSPHTTIEDRDWSDIESQIIINESLLPGLQGVELLSHLVVVFYLHKLEFDRRTDLKVPPNRMDDTMLGIFAARSYYRPNPLGSTTVRLLRVERNVLTVRGLDALDGSPVLDIKPYTP